MSRVSPGMTREQQVAAREREARVLELRKAGATFDEIAQALDYRDKSGAKRAFDRAMRATIQQPADEIRFLEVERLDAMQKALWPKVTAGDTKAIGQCLNVMDRRARLLGLDAPTRQHVTVITRDATEQAIAELEAQLADLQSATDDRRGAARAPKAPAGSAEAGR